MNIFVRVGPFQNQSLIRHLALIFASRFVGEISNQGKDLACIIVRQQGGLPLFSIVDIDPDSGAFGFEFPDEISFFLPGTLSGSSLNLTNPPPTSDQAIELAQSFNRRTF